MDIRLFLLFKEWKNESFSPSGIELSLTGERFVQQLDMFNRKRLEEHLKKIKDKTKNFHVFVDIKPFCFKISMYAEDNEVDDILCEHLETDSDWDSLILGFESLIIKFANELLENNES